MTCKDCIHYCWCKDTIADENWNEDAPKEIKEMYSPVGCENFKNKADFVEVVRCNMRDKMIELVDKAKEEYFNDVTDHTETEYIVECLLNYGIALANPTEKGGIEE